MAVKSVFDIKCFEDVKFLVRTTSFTLRYIEIRKHFLKYHSPCVPAKAFACICVTIFYHILHIVWKWLDGTRGGGGGDVQQPKNPGTKPMKCLFYQVRNK